MWQLVHTMQHRHVLTFAGNSLQLVPLGDFPGRVSALATQLNLHVSSHMQLTFTHMQLTFIHMQVTCSSHSFTCKSHAAHIHSHASHMQLTFIHMQVTCSSHPHACKRQHTCMPLAFSLPRPLFSGDLPTPCR